MVLRIQKVLITEDLDPSCEKLLTKNGAIVTVKKGLSTEDLKKEIENHEVLIVRSATKVTAEVINAGKNLKIIGRAGVGVDNIDVAAATVKGVLVVNAPNGNTNSAAELTCIYIAALSRNLAKACAVLKTGKWDRKSFMGTELQGKTLAIIGLGRIGREVAHRMQSYGMETIGFDPLISEEESAKFGVENLPLEQIWPRANYITVHTPLIPQTINLINATVLAKCPKGVKVINCARGGIIDEAALLDALNSGQCGGAGLDVFSQEPPVCHELIQHPNVIATPHIGASTVEAQSRVAVEISEQLVALMSGRSIHGIVNSRAFTLSMNLRPWTRICTNLGALVSMLFPKTDKDISVVVNVYGRELEGKNDLFTIAVLLGMLKQRLNVKANFINATTFAREAGFQVTEVIANPLKFDNISVEVIGTSLSETHTVLGTLNCGEPALCNIDGCQFRTLPPLTENLIIFKAQHSSDTAMKTIGALVSCGVVDNVAWSKGEDYRWAAVNALKKCKDMPEEVVKQLESWNHCQDFWGQMNL